MSAHITEADRFAELLQGQVAASPVAWSAPTQIPCSVLTLVKRTAADNAARTVIAATLRETGWNVRAAARALGVDDNNLRRECRRLGLRRPQDARAA